MREVDISIKAGIEEFDEGAFHGKLGYVQPWIASCKRIVGRSFTTWEDDGTIIEVETKP